MSVGKLTNNIKNLLAESARNDIRNTEKDDTYYIYIAYTDSEDYPFADSDLSESTLDSDSEHTSGLIMCTLISCPSHTDITFRTAKP